MDVRIIRADFGKVNLEMRRYEALRKSKFGSGWNTYGRKYGIRGLYNLVRTSGVQVEFSNHIGADLRIYEESRMQ